MGETPKGSPSLREDLLERFGIRGGAMTLEPQGRCNGEGDPRNPMSAVTSRLDKTLRGRITLWEERAAGDGRGQLVQH
jgi:hypothetical protein